MHRHDGDVLFDVYEIYVYCCKALAPNPNRYINMSWFTEFCAWSTSFISLRTIRTCS